MPSELDSTKSDRAGIAAAAVQLTGDLLHNMCLLHVAQSVGPIDGSNSTDEARSNLRWIFDPQIWAQLGARDAASSSTGCTNCEAHFAVPQVERGYLVDYD